MCCSTDFLDGPVVRIGVNRIPSGVKLLEVAHCLLSANIFNFYKFGSIEDAAITWGLFSSNLTQQPLETS